MKKNQTKSAANTKNFYAFGTYKPNKNAVPVNYKGTEYLSKAQCMALEGITRKELDAYLNGQEEALVAEMDSAEKVAMDASFDENEDALKQDILADDDQSIDDLLNND